jgi:hypothetical protein
MLLQLIQNWQVSWMIYLFVICVCYRIVLSNLIYIIFRHLQVLDYWDSVEKKSPSQCRHSLFSLIFLWLLSLCALVSYFKRDKYYVGFEVLTAVVMKNTIFWDMTLCSPLSVNRRFGGTYRLHLQGRRNKLSKLAGGKQKGGWGSLPILSYKTTGCYEFKCVPAGDGGGWWMYVHICVLVLVLHIWNFSGFMPKVTLYSSLRVESEVEKYVSRSEAVGCHDECP